MKEVLKRVERSGLTITVLENWLGFKHTHAYTLTKTIQWGKNGIFFSTNDAGTNGHPHAKK